jgi:hypothetical protein
MLLVVLVLAGAIGACSYKEQKTVAAAPAVDAPAGSTTTTTTTKIGF